MLVEGNPRVSLPLSKYSTAPSTRSSLSLHRRPSARHAQLLEPTLHENMVPSYHPPRSNSAPALRPTSQDLWTYVYSLFKNAGTLLAVTLFGWTARVVGPAWEVRAKEELPLGPASLAGTCLPRLRVDSVADGGWMRWRGRRRRETQFVVERAGDFFDFWCRRADEWDGTGIAAEYIANDDSDRGSLDRAKRRRTNDELSTLPPQ